MNWFCGALGDERGGGRKYRRGHLKPKRRLSKERRQGRQSRLSGRDENVGKGRVKP
jgi:hypothetical protein